MNNYTVNTRDVRNRLREVLDSVYLQDKDVVIERNGKAIAAIIPVEDYLALQEELEDLRAGRVADLAYTSWKNQPQNAVTLQDFEASLKRDE
ncbi:MAG: hypothetical protein C0391_00260 [Anaerolinea sp.]|nr:hypothetical protein [Anaerolinea sp.]